MSVRHFRQRGKVPVYGETFRNTKKSWGVPGIGASQLGGEQNLELHDNKLRVKLCLASPKLLQEKTRILQNIAVSLEKIIVV